MTSVEAESLQNTTQIISLEKDNKQFDNSPNKKNEHLINLFSLTISADTTACD